MRPKPITFESIDVISKTTIKPQLIHWDIYEKISHVIKNTDQVIDSQPNKKVHFEFGEPEATYQLKEK